MPNHVFWGALVSERALAKMKMQIVFLGRISPWEVFSVQLLSWTHIRNTYPWLPEVFDQECEALFKPWRLGRKCFHEAVAAVITAIAPTTRMISVSVAVLVLSLPWSN